MNFSGAFKENDYNPFAFKNIKIVGSIQELNVELEDGKPKCLITSNASLDLGFGRKLCREFLSK